VIAALSTQEAVGFTAVVVLGALFGGVAVPAGLLAGLSPAATWIAACLGAISATWLLLLGGGAIRDRLIDRFDERQTARRRAEHLVQRFGARGLGLVGPLFPGVSASCVAGLALGVEARSLARWMSLGSAVLYGAYSVFWWAILRVG
jgi:uncharacterized membrane protein